MNEEELKDLLASMAKMADKVEDLTKDKENQAAIEEAKALKAEQMKLAKDAAKSLVDGLEAKVNEGSEAFAKFVNANKEVLSALSDQIKAESDARVDAKKSVEALSERMDDINEAIKNIGAAGNKFFTGVQGKDLGKVTNEDVKQARDLVLLAWCKSAAMSEPNKPVSFGVFETDAGKAYKEKAVNDSSSIQVSSENYETIFSTTLQRDIEERLVVKPFFKELPMSSKQLTVPLNPDYTYATWVDSAAYGTDASTGSEISVALTETTFRTFKLAAKAYITDETEEDAIMALTPIIYEHLVEAHAKSIEKALISGTGAGNHQPTGMHSHATTLGTVVTATNKVVGDDFRKLRKVMGTYGMRLKDLACVISQQAYWDLLEDEAYKDASKLSSGEVSMLRSGVVGKLYGIDVIISDEIADVAAASTGLAGVVVYTPNYYVPRQRQYITQTDYDVEKQRRVIVNTQRLGFQPIFANSKTVAALELTLS